MTLVKAFIKDKETGSRLQCAFNPSEYSISKSAEWSSTPTTAAVTAPMPQFVGTQPRTLTLDLLFDAWVSGTSGVGDDVDQLLAWTNPTSKSVSRGTPNPPILSFTWGRNSFFDAYLKDVRARLTLFNPDGTPTRATVGVTLVEVPDDPAGQNPSSGSRPGHRMAIVADGDSLHSIAYREYGDPTLWRGLAAWNEIDDPLRLRLGTSLQIPPRELAAERS